MVTTPLGRTPASTTTETSATAMNSRHPTTPSHGATASRGSAVRASAIGNFVEWFDYGVYGYFAVVISRVFFPDSDPSTALLLTFGLFAISFVVRPIGGIFWGRIGDRIGRRTALSASILVMSTSTFLVALLPSYEAIGFAAPLMLMALRMIQGFSASGEYAGAAAYLCEYAPRGQRGRYAAVVPASTAGGLLLGSLLAAVLTAALSTSQLDSWGWRIPFLLAAPLGLVGRHIRLKLADTPEFVEAQSETPEAESPLSLVRRPRALILALGAALLNAVGFYVVLSYLPTYLTEEVGLDSTKSFISSTVALIAYIGLVFATGTLSDRLGRRRTLAIGSVGFIALSVPAFALLGVSGFVGIVVIQVAMGAVLAFNDGVLPSFLAESFPTATRYTGFALSFNVANAVFGGTAPMVATLLISQTGNKIAPAWYLMAAALVTLVAVARAAETAHHPLRR